MPNGAVQPIKEATDISMLAKGLAPVIREFCAASVAPLLDEIKTLREEIRALKSVDVSGAVKSAVDAAIAEIPDPAPGKDADPEEIKRMVDEAVACIELPKPEKALSLDEVKEIVHVTLSVDVTKLRDEIAAIKNAVDAIEPVDIPDVPSLIAEAINALPEPVQPLNADEVREIAGDVVSSSVPVSVESAVNAAMDEAKQAIHEAVSAAVEAIPLPQNGKSVTVDDVAPIIAAEIERQVSLIPAAKDGIGVAGAIIDRENNLVLTLTNGEAKNLGLVVGKDADMEALERRIDEKFASIPVPKDGKDAFALEDFDAELMDDKRTVLLSFSSKDGLDYKIELGFPAMIYRGIYSPEKEYMCGDTVTWGGHLWHCDIDKNNEKPSGEGWTMAVKKGRDAPRMQEAAK